MARKWFCGFCLGITETEGVGPPPQDCRHCRMVRCTNCDTWLKGPDPKFCYGCGTFHPEARAAILSCDSTGGVYVEAEWRKRNVGRRSDGEYYVSTGTDGSHLCRVRKGETDRRDVRELTQDELKVLRERK